MSEPVRTIMALLCVAGLLCTAPMVVADDPEAPPAIPRSGAGGSLAGFLAADGTLSLPAGFSGSLDPKGFRMVQGFGGKPRFVPESTVGEKIFGVPGGCNGGVRAIAVAPSGLVYFGGAFTVCEDMQASNVVSYDPQTRRFQALGSGSSNGVNNVVTALAVSGSDVYVGGRFTEAGGLPANSVARWNGNAWASLGSGVANGVINPALVVGSVNALAVSGSDVYVGGSFTLAGGLPANRIARWNGSTWSPLGGPADNGINGQESFLSVDALAVSGRDLFVGGLFFQAGGQPANSVARWNGSVWSSMGSGEGNGVNSLESDFNRVFALAVSGGDLYVGGDFTHAGGLPANRIARWNGSAWSSLGNGDGNGLASSGSNLSSVYSLAVSGGDLYVGGYFTYAGGLPANRIARWNGSAWSSLGSGDGNGLASTRSDADYSSVNALAVSGGDLYVGGGFTQAGSQSANNTASWNGGAWSTLGNSTGNGVNGWISALAVLGSDLYVGGIFTQAGGRPASNIARWNGSAWSTLGSGARNGVNDWVLALAVSGNDLYVGGYFTQAGGQRVNRIARWNGSTWSSLGSVADNGVTYALDGDDYASVRALAVSGSDLYVGGSFNEAGGQPAGDVARWNGSSWFSLGSGARNGVAGLWVSALAVSGNDLYVGGDFFRAGDQPANNIARWNGSAWFPLSRGSFDGVTSPDSFFLAEVHALAISGNSLYVGGDFTHAGGLPANNIARWNGSAWSSLGSGVVGAGFLSVLALAVSGGDLYVGGRFGQAGGQRANGLARWDGGEWRGLATDEPPQEVYALASDATSLFVGGSGLAQTPLPELQSKSTTGTPANGASRATVVSRLGNRIGFASDASNLVSGDVNARTDIFVRDPVSGAATRASAAAEAINGGASESFSDPALSADGARVAYAGSSGQIYATIGSQGRVLSRSAAGALGNGPSGKPNLPGSGNLAYFESQATNLLSSPDGNGSVADIFVTDLATGAVTLITRGPDGEPANGASSAPWASDDGLTIAFSTLATNLVPGSATLPAGIKSGTIRQATVMRESGRSSFYVSRNLTSGQVGNGNSINVRITPDGRYGVFESVATNLVDDDSNNVSDVFRFEIANNAVTRLERVSTSRLGFQGNGASKNASISDDGQFITFETDATNLIELDRNNTTDILVKWMVTGEVVRLSRTVDGQQPNGPSVQPTISGDGSTIVFGSGATNLTPGDLNNAQDVFSVNLRARGPALVTGPLDEPGLSQYALPAPDPANANCPSGFFSAVVDDGPGSGLTSGAFGMEVLLDEPGTRVLAGGLNFGGLIDAGQVGFAGFTIANAANEAQRLNLSLTGSPSSSSTLSLPVRIRIARRTATTSETVFESTQTISLVSPYVTSIDLPPAFYEATVAPVSGSAGGTPEGQFFFSLTTSFINRPGGGFQGGAVVGGYHATHPFGGVSGFAGFCLATPHTTTIRVLSQPSYGPTGAKDLRLRIQDAQQRDVLVVPAD